jgi:hypothetical protein
MEKFALAVAEGIRAQALKSTAKGKMDKSTERQITPSNKQLNNEIGETQNIQNSDIRDSRVPEMAQPQPASQARHQKIKDPYVMQQLLDRERARIQGVTEIPTSYSLEPPPFANPDRTPTLPAAKDSANANYFLSAKDRAELSAINRQLDGSGQAGMSSRRHAYATTYGILPKSSPYDDEVDIMADTDAKYQEVAHWYSNLEKPDEDNLEILKKLNHDRLSTLQVKYRNIRTDQDEISNLNKGKQGFNADFIRNSLVERSLSKRGLSAKKRAQFTNDFEGYLKNKHKASGKGDYDFLVDFDRYECTSPDPKRVHKDHSLLYKENM